MPAHLLLHARWRCNFTRETEDIRGYPLSILKEPQYLGMSLQLGEMNMHIDAGKYEKMTRMVPYLSAGVIYTSTVHSGSEGQ